MKNVLFSQCCQLRVSFITKKDAMKMFEESRQAPKFGHDAPLVRKKLECSIAPVAYRLSRLMRVPPVLAFYSPIVARLR